MLLCSVILMCLLVAVKTSINVTRGAKDIIYEKNPGECNRLYEADHVDYKWCKCSQYEKETFYSFGTHAEAKCSGKDGREIYLMDSGQNNVIIKKAGKQCMQCRIIQVWNLQSGTIIGNKRIGIWQNISKPQDFITCQKTQGNNCKVSITGIPKESLTGHLFRLKISFKECLIKVTGTTTYPYNIKTTFPQFLEEDTTANPPTTTTTTTTTTVPTTTTTSTLTTATTTPPPSKDKAGMSTSIIAALSAVCAVVIILVIIIIVMCRKRVKQKASGIDNLKNHKNGIVSNENMHMLPINTLHNKSTPQTDIVNPVYQGLQIIISNADSTYSVIGENTNTYSEVGRPRQESTESTNCLITNHSPNSCTGLSSISENFGTWNHQAPSSGTYEGIAKGASNSSLPLYIEPIETVNDYEMPQDSYTAIDNSMIATQQLYSFRFADKNIYE